MTSAQGKAIVVVLAAWLLWPALYSVHPEAFSAQIQIGAIAANQGLLDQANLSYPIHAEFFYLTRQGVVYLLQGLMAMTGRTDDFVFRALTFCSLVVMTVSTLVFARRHGVDPWYAGVALLLTPGLPEMSFSFNDNIVSAAFAMLAFALLPRPRGSLADEARFEGVRAVQGLRAVVAGAALAFAILCRPDVLLLVPLFAAFVWLEDANLKRVAAILSCIAIGAVALLLVSRALSGADLLQTIRVARVFDRIQANFLNIAHQAINFLFFIGLPQLLLLPLGAVATWRGTTSRRNAERLVLIAIPALMLLYFLGKSQMPRHFYPLLAPVIAIVGGRGIATVVARLGAPTERRRLIGATVAVVIGISWLIPSLAVRLYDGPRSPFGRLWSPVIWHRWQNAVLEDRRDIEQWVDRADAGMPVVMLTTQFNADFYLRLSLWQHGYRAKLAGDTAMGCKGGFEVWESPAHPGRSLIHVRSEDPHFMASPPAYIQAVQLQRAFACKPLLGSAAIVVSGLGTPDRDWYPDLEQPLAWQRLPDSPLDRHAFGWSPGWLLGATPNGKLRKLLASESVLRNESAVLSAKQVATLSSEVDAVVNHYRKKQPMPDYEAVMALFGPATSWPAPGRHPVVWVDR